MQSDYKFLIHDSNQFKLHELELAEIAKVKWIESEKTGSDIGIYRAEWIWWAYYRDKWRAGLRESGVI